MISIKELEAASNDLIIAFNKYCENTECNRICPSDRTLKCFAEYIVKTYIKESDVSEEDEEK